MSLVVLAGFPALVTLGNHKHICRYEVAHSEVFAMGQVPSSPGRRKEKTKMLDAAEGRGSPITYHIASGSSGSSTLSSQK